MEINQEVQQRNCDDLCEWFLQIIRSDPGRIEPFSGFGYNDWFLPLFKLTGVDDIDLAMKQKESVDFVWKAIEIAYHEAGHAIVGWRHGYYFGQEGIVLETRHHGGFCSLTWMKDDEGMDMSDSDFCPNMSIKSMNSHVADINLQVFLAGYAATHKFYSLYYEKPIPKVWLVGQDYDDALTIVHQEYGLKGKEAGKYIRKTYRRVSRLLDHPKTWAAVKAIVEGLLRHPKCLSHYAATKIISQINPPRSKVMISIEKICAECEFRHQEGVCVHPPWVLWPRP